MNQTTFQPAEIYDSNGNLIQQGAFGINTPFCTSTGDGVYDYIVNNLNALKDMIAAGYIAVATLPASGQINKYYVITEGANAGKCYIWTGTAWQELTTQINGKSAYEIAVEHGFIGTEQQWLDSFTADATAAADRAEAVQAQMEEKFSILDNVDARFGNIEDHAEMTYSNVDATKKRISNVEKLLQGNLYDYQTDSTEAYTKSVPSGAMPYAGLEQIGGKTVVWNQLIQTSDLRSGTSGTITLSIVDGKTINISGSTGDSSVYPWLINSTILVNGHKYVIKVLNYDSSIMNNIRVDAGTSIYFNNDSSIFTASDTRLTLYIYLKLNLESFSTSITPQVFDLTLMFGAGNEPTTVEQFREMFPAEYYPYNAGTLLSAGVTEVVSKKADTTTIATYPIPAEIRNIEGYGWSAGNAYNYIDFERKVFVQNVGRVDLGTLNYVYTAAQDYFFTSSLYGIKKAGRLNFVCDTYSLTTVALADMPNMSIRGNPDAGGLYFKNTAYTDATAFKAAVNGVILYYELATPIETDISAYLSDDNLIEVESGGTLTMYSDANGDDDAYHIPVPSTVEYMIDLNVATGGTENEP